MKAKAAMKEEEKTISSIFLRRTHKGDGSWGG